jgi:hypothetical protein
MRMEIHHKIGKAVCGELRKSGCRIDERLFLLGNLFPDLIHSYIWCRHEYQHSREYIRKKMDMLKKRPKLISFHLGILTHYICDYFCYSHSSCFGKGLIQHIIYEVKQKIPEKIYKTNLNVKACTIEELDRFVIWYESFCAFIEDDESDFHIATMVASNFLQAAY